MRAAGRRASLIPPVRSVAFTVRSISPKWHLRRGIRPRASRIAPGTDRLMRSSKQRQRTKQNRNNRPTGGNIINRVFDSSGPEGKVRGTPAQIIEKYLQLHRDAQLAGDRVNAENFAQHAEHYTRILA